MDNNTDLSGIIEKLMSDPAAMEMVQKLKQGTLSEASDVVSEAVSQPTGDTTGRNDTAKMLSAIAPLLKGISGSADASSPEQRRRNQLFYALKPYLSSERQELIDTLTSLSGVSGVLDMLSNGGKRPDGH